jgi:uncharacterized protein YkwD
MLSKTFFTAILFIACIFSQPPAIWAQAIQPDKEIEAEILKLVNEHRKEMKLKPLRMNGILTGAARTHTRNMATKAIPFGHEGFNDRMKQLYKQLKPVYSFAENVAYGSNTAKEVVAQWLNSPEHKKNIEGADYNITGIGAMKGTDGVMYYTEIFIFRGS